MSLTTNVMKNSSTVFITFMADWCQPCKRMKPLVDELEQENPDIEFVRISIDTEEGSTLAQHFGVRSVPFFALTKDGSVLGVSPGSKPKENLAAFIEGHAK